MSGGRRLVFSGVALTALLALVAIASRAHHPGGGSGATPARPPLLLAEYVASLMVVLLPLGAIVVIWAWSLRRREALLRGGANWRQFVTLLGLALIMLPFALFGRHLLHHGNSTQPKAGIASGQSSGKKKKQPPRQTPVTQPFHFQLLPALVLGSVILGLGVVAGGALLKKRREGDVWEQEAALAAALDEVLADTLDDLRAERDPRVAVIRTYARMERTFAAYGVPREEAETSLEYVERVLARLSVSSFSTGRLTQLFSRAKFSPHEIDAGMKEEAIEALAGLRAELEHKPEAA